MLLPRKPRKSRPNKSKKQQAWHPNLVVLWESAPAQTGPSFRVLVRETTMWSWKKTRTTPTRHRLPLAQRQMISMSRTKQNRKEETRIYPLWAHCIRLMQSKRVRIFVQHVDRACRKPRIAHHKLMKDIAAQPLLTIKELLQASHREAQNPLNHPWKALQEWECKRNWTRSKNQAASQREYYFRRQMSLKTKALRVWTLSRRVLSTVRVILRY